ncbi:HNH endonuclease [Baekduia alba]|uniref:HNH endonuclease n=1 Tax=Baekduia alba TaxID=2997333 RepID=UPI0032C48F9E
MEEVQGYCGRPCEHIDHVVARARGGQDAWPNLTASCARGNGRKQHNSLLASPAGRVRQRGEHALRRRAHEAATFAAYARNSSVSCSRPRVLLAGFWARCSSDASAGGRTGVSSAAMHAHAYL